MKYVFFILLLVHGLIHVMGFVKARRPDKLRQFSKPVSAAAGTGWLLAAILFLISASIMILGDVRWWMTAIPAVALSQTLIFSYWFDARFGTPLNAIILLACIAAFGSWKFKAGAAEAYNHLMLANGPSHAMPARPVALSNLPPPVQKWYASSKAGIQSEANCVFLTQTGRMRTDATGKWMPVYARQWYDLKDPGFLWLARVVVGPGIRLLGRDSYTNGRGHMLIKAAGLFTVANAQGRETDQGAALRFLGELVWFPSRIVAPYLSWESMGPLAAKATLNWEGARVSGIFRFYENGDVRSFEADRYYDRASTATLEKWLVTCDSLGFKEFNGVRIPAKAKVTWNLEEGSFTWFELEVTRLNYAKEPSLLPGI